MDGLAKDLMIGAIVAILYFSLWFLPAARKKRLDYADIAWGGAFALIALVQFWTHWQTVTYAQALVCLCVLIWGVRLSAHLGKRILSRKEEDPRYTEIRQKQKKYSLLRSYTHIFLLQAALVWVISLPLTAIWQSDLEALGGLFIGLSVWAVGFVLETIGDKQLSSFIKNPKNKGKIMKRGLWKYSRHPNYFGEITQWWGIWLMSLYLHPVWWSIAGPITITLLIRFVSGVPPIERRKQHDKQYQRYKAKTSMLVPGIPK